MKTLLPARIPAGWRSRCAAAVALCAVATGASSVPVCTIADSASLAFGPVIALASTVSVSTNSGTSFWVNCTADVATTPSLYSSSTRSMTNGASSLPFNLSLVSAGGAELPSTSPGTSLSIVKNGTNQTVTLYGRVTAASFKALSSGHYTGLITLTLVY